MLIFLAVFVSGCITPFTTGPGAFYKNDVITLEDYVITETKPIPGSTTTIKFLIRNNGDKEVPRVRIDFFDTKGIQTEVECKNGNTLSDRECEYNNIESLDERSFAITFKIPDQKDIAGPASFNINYQIEYEYQGSRRITIPVIDFDKIKKPLTKFQTGQPSIGPIAVEFDPPVGSTSRRDSQIVKEYWGTKGEALEVKVNFKQVSSSSVGQVIPTKVEAGKASLKLIGMTVDGKRRCDFEGTSGTISSKFDVTVPASIVCNFRADSFAGQEKTVSIDAQFSYTYQIQRSETITINVERTRQIEKKG